MIVLGARSPNPKVRLYTNRPVYLIRRFFPSYRVRLGRPNPLKEVGLGSKSKTPQFNHRHRPSPEPLCDSLFRSEPRRSRTHKPEKHTGKMAGVLKARV